MQHFASRSLEAIYGVTDFKLDANRHMLANQMYDEMAGGGKWVKLGLVFDETNNLCAQSMSNNGWPVIAAIKGTPHGHVALVVPGEPAKTGNSWAGILAANSASFRYERPDEAYVNKPLSNPFGAEAAKKASFFYRRP